MPETQLSAEQRAVVVEIGKELKEAYGTLPEDVKRLGSASAETTEKLAKLTEAMAGLHEAQAKASERFESVERAVTAAKTAPEPIKGFGVQVVENAEFLKFTQGGGKGQINIQLKGSIHGGGQGQKDIAFLSQTMMADRLNFIAAPPHLPFGVRTIIPPGRTTAGAVEFIRETSFTNNANVVAELALKPQSDKTFADVVEPVRTIAHFFKISKQSFDDLPFLAAQIESNGIYGVQLKEDWELLNGNATAPHLNGLLRNAGLATPPPAVVAPAPANTLIDAIGGAFFQLAATGYLPDAGVVNPADWGVVSLIKNSQGNYLFSNPLSYGASLSVWGMKLVMSANMGVGTFLIGAFKGNTQLLDRETVNVQIANQNEDDFVKNRYTILIEERLVLAVYNPGALLHGVVPVALIQE